MEDVEREYQLFGFGRRRFGECVRAFVDEQIAATMRKVRADVVDGDARRDAIVDGIERLLVANCEAPLERLTARIDDTFRVPPHTGWETPPSDERVAQVATATEAARRRALAAAADRRALRRELDAVEELRSVVADSRTVMDIFENLPHPTETFPQDFLDRHAHYVFPEKKT